MSEVVTILAVIFAMYMTWRGYSRGALSTVVNYIPPVLALAALTLVVWFNQQTPSVGIVAGSTLAFVTFLTGTLVLRIFRHHRRLRRISEMADEQPHRWYWWCDRAAGAGFGFLCSATACIGIACLVSTLSFAYTATSPEIVDKHKSDTQPNWVAKLKESCLVLADLSDNTVLGHVPRLREYGQEMSALVRILNADPDDLKRVAEKHGLTTLQELPAVKTALDDKHYAELFLQLKEGNLSAVKELVDSSITRDLVSCPEIHELTQKLTPSSLAQDLTKHQESKLTASNNSTLEAGQPVR